MAKNGEKRNHQNVNADIIECFLRQGFLLYLAENHPISMAFFFETGRMAGLWKTFLMNLPTADSLSSARVKRMSANY